MAARFEMKLRKEFASVMRDIDKKDQELRKQAATHIADKVRAKIDKVNPLMSGDPERKRDSHGRFLKGASRYRVPSLPGEPPAKVTGNLLKGLKVKSGKVVALVGFVKPGFHALLLEFGAYQRMHSKNKSIANPMAARPVLFPTFAEERGAVMSILSERRV